MSTPRGIDGARIEGWLESQVAGAMGPFHFDLIKGGHSNLTYAVTDAQGDRFVLRRPPLGKVLASAHDMVREHRVLSALAGTLVPVPKTLGLCEDPDIIGASFYLMEFIDGMVVRDNEMSSSALDEASRRFVSENLVATLAAIHSVDIDSVGLGDLGARDGYIARQLRRWKRQWDAEKTRDLPLVDRVHDRLVEKIPEQQAATIVHGDFKIDNCLLSYQDPDRGKVIGVLDWEICTLGDPLADLGLLIAYWEEPGQEPVLWPDGATQVPGFLRRSEVLQLYSQLTGQELSAFPFYEAFAYWKLVCIVEGVYSRYLSGGLTSASDRQLARFKAQVEIAAIRAHELLDSLC